MLVLLLIFFTNFSQNFSERALLVLKDSITISITKIGIVASVTLIEPCLFRADFNHGFQSRFQSLFSAQWNTLKITEQCNKLRVVTHRNLCSHSRLCIKISSCENKRHHALAEDTVLILKSFYRPKTITTMTASITVQTFLHIQQ